jgi:DNA-binding CsgD family transcriptional regulator
MTECINKKYPLGSKYQGIVLNHREAMCMRYLLKKYNIPRIAKQMKLSPRTIGFYIGSVMLQLKCESLQKLLDAIKQSELLRYFD